MLETSIAANPYNDVDFDVPLVLGNIDRLPMNIFVDNVAYAPCAYLVADDVNPSTGAWASRHDSTKALAVAGAGADPTYGNYSPLENTAIKYAAAKYHVAADTTWGQLGTDDFCLEIVYRHGTGSKVLAATFGNTPGYELFINSGNLTFYANDSSATTFLSSPAVTEDVWYHVICFCDRSENFYWYFNGVYNTSAAFTPTASLTSTYAMTIGIRPDGIWALDREVAHFGLWSLAGTPFPGALKNRTYFDRIARERFAIVSGIEDQRKGNHSFTRATTAYSDKYISSTERRLFKLSSGWPRICQRKDANGLSVQGYLPEPQAINLITRSGDFVTTWAKLDAGDVTNNAWTTGPDGDASAARLVSSATDGVHGISIDATLTAATYIFSVYIRANYKSWIMLSDNTVANATCYFDVSTGAVGTAGAGCTGYIEGPFLNAFYRCWIVFTGTAAAHTLAIYAADADNDNSFAGTGASDCYFYGAQCELATELFPTSYIPTAGAAATRNKDELSYNIRLPIVGNINDLSQSINIGGTDYDPCAYLVADDCQADGTWLSRTDVHNNILIDGDMEAADTSYWTAGGAAALSKESGTPHGGSLCMRCARNGTDNPYFRRSSSTVIGFSYTLSGYVRSDGNATPLIKDSGGPTLWTGTTSTSWQAFNITYTAVGNHPYFYNITSTGTEYVEWDDFTLISNETNTLAFAGAGTNPTPNWSAVSRSNTSVKYWASKYHTAADTTWGQIGDNDGAVEAILVTKLGNTMSTRASGSLAGYGVGQAATGAVSFIIGDGTDYVNTTGGSPTATEGTIVHFMAFIDKSDKVYYFANGIYVGVSASTAAIGDSTGGPLAFGALSGGVSATEGMPALFSVWDLTANPWPGAATNQAVMAAIARARYNQLFRYQSCRLDCEILHPDVDRLTTGVTCFLGLTASDFAYMGIVAAENGFLSITTNAVSQVGISGSDDLCNNVKVKQSGTIRTDNSTYKENNSQKSSDLSCLVPPITAVKVGQYYTGGFQPACLVSKVKLTRNDQ